MFVSVGGARVASERARDLRVRGGRARGAGGAVRGARGGAAAARRRRVAAAGRAADCCRHHRCHTLRARAPARDARRAPQRRARLVRAVARGTTKC